MEPLNFLEVAIAGAVANATYACIAAIIKKRAWLAELAWSLVAWCCIIGASVSSTLIGYRVADVTYSSSHTLIAYGACSSFGYYLPSGSKSHKILVACVTPMVVTLVFAVVYLGVA